MRVSVCTRVWAVASVTSGCVCVRVGVGPSRCNVEHPDPAPCGVFRARSSQLNVVPPC